MTLEALAKDWEETDFGFSQYVICVEHRLTKEPSNLIRNDGTGITTAQRAVTCLRLAGRGDVTMGPMWFTRSAKFNVGLGAGASRGGWQVPVAGGATEFVLTRRIGHTVRTLQPALAYLDEHGYSQGPGNLDLAIRSFNSTYDRFPLHNDSQLLDTITAMEALLGTGLTELTFKLSYRVAGLLGRSAEERLQIFDAMKDFYDARSKTVHGAPLKAKQHRALGNVDDARDFVRRLLMSFVRLAASPSPRYTPKFFKEDLDAVLQDESARRDLLQALGLARI